MVKNVWTYILWLLFNIDAITTVVTSFRWMKKWRRWNLSPPSGVFLGEKLTVALGYHCGDLKSSNGHHQWWFSPMVFPKLFYLKIEGPHTEKRLRNNDASSLIHGPEEYVHRFHVLTQLWHSQRPRPLVLTSPHNVSRPPWMDRASSLCCFTPGLSLHNPTINGIQWKSNTKPWVSSSKEKANESCLKLMGKPSCSRETTSSFTTAVSHRLLQSVTAQVSRAHTQDEAYGVH